MSERPGPLLRALAATSLLYACELVLARFGDNAVPWPDVLMSGLGLALLGVVPVWALQRYRDDPRERLAAAVCGHLGLGMVACAIALPLDVVRAPVATGIGVAVGCALAGAALRLDLDEIPGPTAVFGVLTAAWMASWALCGSLPELDLLRSVLPCWLAFALLTAQPQLFPLTVALGALVARGILLPDALPRSPHSAQGQPDIVLITIDTLRADTARELEAYQQLQPLPDAVAAAPWTLPSMASILTGQPLWKHGAGRTSVGTDGVSDEVTTLAELLSARGYRTLAFVDRNLWLEPALGLQVGFDGYFHTRRLRHRGGTVTTGRPLFGRIAQELGVPGPSELAPQRLVDRALETVATQPGDPLFLWLHFMDLHLPYTHVDRTALPAEAKHGLTAAKRGEILADPAWKSGEPVAWLRRAYRNEAELIDDAVVRLLASLPADRERVVVLTADHGEELWEHGGFEHGHALWQEVISVPLAISGVEVADGDWVPTHIDIAPTLLAAAGGDPSSLPGRDLSHPVQPTVHLTGNLVHGGRPDDRWAVRDGLWKAVFEPDGTALYHLGRDPGERTNVAADHPERVERYRSLEWRDLDGAGRAVSLDALQRQHLEALGYLEE